VARIGKHSLAGLLLGVMLLGGACDHRERRSQAPGLATPTTAARLAKPCLGDVGTARPFRFRTPAGAVLVGVVIGHGPTGLVFAHGRGGDLCEWLPRARAFADRGYQALAFDFEGFGDSRPGSGPGAGIEGDVVAATEQLRRRGADRVLLIGSSMGATAVLSAATRIRPPVAGVVSLSGPGAFGAVNAWAAMPHLRVPVRRRPRRVVIQAPGRALGSPALRGHWPLDAGAAVRRPAEDGATRGGSGWLVLELGGSRNAEPPGRRHPGKTGPWWHSTLTPAPDTNPTRSGHPNGPLDRTAELVGHRPRGGRTGAPS
jgi:pimeloyl-ACP methyl ester carboxylesterase